MCKYMESQLDKILELISNNQSLSSKDFWSLRELIQERGWSKPVIDTLVKEGKLTPVKVGGKAGDRYPSDQLIRYMKTFLVKS
jgi:hypothetical protein